jgi:hypothetical protein
MFMSSATVSPLQYQHKYSYFDIPLLYPKSTEIELVGKTHPAFNDSACGEFVIGFTFTPIDALMLATCATVTFANFVNSPNSPAFTFITTDVARFGAKSVSVGCTASSIDELLGRLNSIQAVLSA